MKRLHGSGILALIHLTLTLTTLANEPADSPLFDIPRLADIVIDGKINDWGSTGFRVEALAALDGTVRAPADLDAQLRLGWDVCGLLVALTVRDDVAVESKGKDVLFQNDAVELFLADRRGGTQLVQVVASPGRDASFPDLRWHGYDHRKDATLKKTAVTVEVARVTTSNGYVMEVRLPWSNIGITPTVGREAGFQLFVDEMDLAGMTPFRLLWYPATGTFVDTRRTHRLRLSESTSPTVCAAGRAFYEGMKELTVRAAATADWAGKPVTAEADGKTVARGKLTATADRSTARFRAPIPPPGLTWTTLVIRVDGTPVDTIPLPDLAAVRERARGQLALRFRPFCFSGATFPECEFKDPAEAETVLGRTAVNVSYYDTQYRRVTSAEKPGRYGAVVEIQPEQGPLLRQFYTLFKLQGPLDWRTDAPPLPVNFLPGLGLTPAVVREQSGAVGQFFKEQLKAVLDESSDTAIFLAWLAETRPGTRITNRNNARSRQLTWMHGLKKSLGYAEPLPYQVHLPAAAARDAVTKRPTILYLHGSGERFVPFQKLTAEALLTYARGHTNFPFIVITPQCPKSDVWQVPALDDLYEAVMTNYPIDPDRFYVTGLSMGGFGSWALAAEHPDRFAAVVPICGGGDPGEADLIKDLPFWVFHGAKDPVVPVRRSDDMVAALRAVNGRVRYTVYPDGLHTIWNDVYNTDALYDWLLLQTRGKPAEPPAGKIIETTR